MMEPNFDQDFSLPIVATVCWLLLLQLFGVVQAFSQPNLFDPSRRFDYANHPLWCCMDRAFQNMHEQTTMLIVVVWLNAIFVDAPMAGTLGLYAVGARSFYPMLRSIKIQFMGMSTIIHYFITYNLALNLLAIAIKGKPNFVSLQWENVPSMLLYLACSYGSTIVLAFPYLKILKILMGEDKKKAAESKGEEKSK